MSAQNWGNADCGVGKTTPTTAVIILRYQVANQEQRTCVLWRVQT